jgi:hypothetical protein
VDPCYTRSLDGKYIVRLYDKFDGYWIDVSEHLTEEEAVRLWKEKTCNGTQHVKYDDGYYYAIFPYDTKMIYDGSWEDPDDVKW